MKFAWACATCCAATATSRPDEASRLVSSSQARPRVFSTRVVAARQAYLALERRLTREGLGRREAETLLEFARRLEREELEAKEAALDQIRAFAALRYASEEA